MRYLHDANVDGNIELTPTHTPNIPKKVEPKSILTVLTEISVIEFVLSPISVI